MKGKVPRNAEETWTAGPSGMRLRSWLVSFQRYVRPTEGWIEAIPSSLGALPPMPWEGFFLLPVARDEAFWIGVTPRETIGLETVELSGARVGGGMERLTTRALGPETSAVVAAGWTLSDRRLEVFCANTIAGIRLAVGARTAEVLLVDPQTFAARIGLTSPLLNHNAGYKGWRLP